MEDRRSSTHTPKKTSNIFELAQLRTLNFPLNEFIINIKKKTFLSSMINRRVQKFLDVQSIIQLLAPNIKIIVKVTNKSISVILRKIIEDSLGR